MLKANNAVRFNRLALALFALLMASLGLGTTQPAEAAGRVPVIIIPGVAGSTFKTGPGYTYSGPNGRGGTYTHTYGSGETVWVNVLEAAWPGEDDYFDTMRLSADADTPYVPYSNLYVSGIYESAYSDMIDYLHRQGYVDGVTLFVFAYDWRRDIQAATYNNLDALVNQARNAAGTSQVDILGHSMGGLVGHNYVSYPATAAKVRRLITFGTPYLGAPKFLKTLVYGDQFGPTFLGLGLNQDAVKDLVQNMAGGWQLLPSRSYYNFYNNTNSNLLPPYREDRDVDGNGVASGALSYEGTISFLRNLGKNQNASNRAVNFHDRLDKTWLSGPKVTFINGSGLATIAQVRDYTGSCWSWFSYKPCPKTDTYTLDGDGTVPYYSATPYDPARGMDMSGPASIYLVNQEHGALVQYERTLGIKTSDGAALTLLGQILNNQVEPLSATSQSALLGDQIGTQAQGKGKLVNRSTKLGGYWIGVSNGAQLEVLGEEGKRTGRAANNKVEQTIQGSTLETFDNAEFAYVPASSKGYTLRVKGSATGSFDLKIRQLNGDKIEQTVIFLNVPAQEGEIADLSLRELTGAAPKLRVGKQEISGFVLDAAQSVDQTAPTLEVANPAIVSRGLRGYRVTWQAQDGLAGLNFEQAVLNPESANPQIVKNGQMLQLTPGAYTLQVMAQDRAGNTAIKEVKFSVSEKNPKNIETEPGQN